MTARRNRHPRPCTLCQRPTAKTICDHCDTGTTASYSSAEYQTNRATVIAEETHCVRCGEPVDRTLPGTHPQGPTADHIRPRAHGGDDSRTNLRLAHQTCNSRAGTVGGHNVVVNGNPPPRSARTILAVCTESGFDAGA